MRDDFEQTVTFPTEMLDGDLLSQLSTEFGLGADFLDDASTGSGSSSSGIGSSGSTQMDTEIFCQQLMQDDESLFSEIMQQDVFSPESLSLKSEPYSPSSQSSNSPPPSSHSDDSSSQQLGLPIPLSPPYSPSNLAFATPTPAPRVVMEGQTTTAPVVSIQGTDLTNFKIPIPKITKPATTKLAPTGHTPLVLTSSQIAQLTQSGVLKVSNGSTPVVQQMQPQPLIIKTEPNLASPMRTAGPTVQTIPFTPTNVQDIDMKTIKRQQRMIKNRESACLSRKKKKEYVTSLEEQIQMMDKENKSLREENSNLKARVRELESEKSIWTDTVLNRDNAKKGTVLLAVLLVVSVNIMPLSDLYSRQAPTLSNPLKPVSSPDFPFSDPKSVVDSPSYRTGRSLLWANASTDDIIPSVEYANVTTAAPICPMYFNQTESIRLDNQLRGWFRLDPKEMEKKSFQDEKVNAMSTSTSLGHYYNKKRRVQKAPRLQPNGVYHMIVPDNTADTVVRRKASSSSAITVYDSDSPRFSYDSFFDAIDRREDTFYVVSFSGDHLLLPASKHNQTSRPRMSLLLPSMAVSLNDSMKAPANHIAMMQIDCEVMNTRLVYIKDDAIPMHMSAQMRPENNSSIQRNQSNDDTNDELYKINKEEDQAKRMWKGQKQTFNSTNKVKGKG